MPLISSRPEAIRYRHVLLTFMGVLLTASLVADALLVTQQHRELHQQALTDWRRELNLLANWVGTAIRDGGLAEARAALSEWARSDPTIVELTAIGPDGQAIYHYQRSKPAAHTLQVTYDMPFDGGQLQLFLRRDVSRIERVMGQVRLQLIAGSLVFIAVLGSFLWVTVRRMALLPMRRYETELQMHRYRLERLVQERTVELTSANRNLQREVNERVQAEQELRRSTERLSVLREIDQAILGARSLRAIAEGALHHMRQLLPCRRASVALFDLAAGEAELLAVRSDEPTRLHAGQRFPIDVTAIPTTLRNGEPFLVDNIRALEQRSPMERILAEEGVEGYAIIPLIYQGELLGILHLATASDTACDREFLDVAGEIADVLAVAIQQVRLVERVQHHAQELEQRVAERTRALQDAQTELEAFTYSISHDLRGHIWTVQGFTGLLLEKFGERLPDEALDYLNSVVEAARTMNLLIQDLLTYANLARGELLISPVSLDRAVRASLERLADKVHERHARISIEAPLGEAQGHEATLVQVVTQIVDNALTYVASGTVPEIRIRTEPHDSRVRLVIEDNGVGIPPDQRDRIFQVFQRLPGEEAYPGTGIGLAIVQRGVARMGGEVGVDSEPGAGSRFWVDLDADIEQQRRLGAG